MVLEHVRSLKYTFSRFEEYETIVPATSNKDASSSSGGGGSGSGSGGGKIRSHTIIVRWNDAPIGHFLTNYDSKLSFEYTIDINPSPTNELGLKSVLYKQVGFDGTPLACYILSNSTSLEGLPFEQRGRRHAGEQPPPPVLLE